MKTFSNMAEMLKLHGVSAKDIMLTTGKTKSFASLILNGKSNLPVKYHKSLSEGSNIDPMDFQVAHINDCMDNYKRSLK